MFHRARLLAVFLLGCGLPALAVDLDREIVLTPPGGSAPEDRAILRWQQGVLGRPDAPAPLEGLGWAYVAKARRTLDAGWFKLAEKTADVMDARFGAGAESRLLRGHAWHNLHRFADAERVARELVAARGLPADLALLSDTLVEQGRVAEAAEVLQRLLDLKPGTEALARVAHVRWLSGDLAGARSAAESAWRAANPLDVETSAWLLCRRSALALQAGEAGEALALARAAAERLEAFAPALLAAGRALLALGRNAEAVAALEAAADLNPSPEYQWWLADALRAEGRPVPAERLEAEIAGRGAGADPRTVALFLATRRREPGRAERLARDELARRPDAFSHDALAWALAAGGDWIGADAAMRRALATPGRDARLFLHAGVIAAASGRPDAAAGFLREAHAARAMLTPSELALLERTAPDADHSVLSP
jgi:tetratricopeptide (TPR) repeat protein